jgi:hypothetical protein
VGLVAGLDTDVKLGSVEVPDEVPGLDAVLDYPADRVAREPYLHCWEAKV